MNATCECGCGGLIGAVPRSDRGPNRFLKGHNFSRTKVPIVCVQCGNAFMPWHKHTKFCSHKCSAIFNGKLTIKRVTKICAVCNSEFEVHQHREKAKYCSKACWSVRKPPISFNCKYCGKPFIARSRAAGFCSRSCAGKARTGAESNAWKGGVSLLNERARLMPLARVWAAAVLKKDSFKCVRCGVMGKLHAHHIKAWALFPDLRFELTNGMTLCEKCHSAEHGRNLTIPRTKICPGCGAITTGRGKLGRCKSCAGKDSYTKPSGLVGIPA